MAAQAHRLSWSRGVLRALLLLVWGMGTTGAAGAEKPCPDRFVLYADIPGFRGMMYMSWGQQSYDRFARSAFRLFLFPDIQDAAVDYLSGARLVINLVATEKAYRVPQEKQP
jgi:hypothetical protein